MILYDIFMIARCEYCYLLSYVLYTVLIIQQYNFYGYYLPGLQFSTFIYKAVGSFVQLNRYKS